MDSHIKSIFQSKLENTLKNDFNMDSIACDQFYKRCIRSCKRYLRSKNIDDKYDLLLNSKINYLILKLDNEQLKNIFTKRYRIKDVIITTIYNTNPILNEMQTEINSKCLTNSSSCNIYICPKCGKREHTYKEVMTRALDEPKTVKCECLVCGYKFRK